ncbi:MAG: electron transfer flavoprotein subunit alpha/FixB family protein [Deferrisomatales bacterium]|nr:electron transfer flavoprotein subunit alpha/FixB family protein [Deferrisomatales bacterium]
MGSDAAPDRLRAGVLAFSQLPEGELDDADKGVLNEAGRLARLLEAGLLATCFPPSAGDAEEDAGDGVSLEGFGGRLSWRPTDPGFLRTAGAATVPLAGFGSYGVAEVFELATERDLSDYPDARAEALVQAARACGAGVVALAHNDQGSALAPGLAVGLGAALWTEIVAFERTEQGLLLSRQALGTQALECRLWDGSVPLVLTVNPRRTSATVLPSVRPSHPRLSRVPVTPTEPAYRQRVVARVPPDPQTVDVTEAELIFCAGKGFDPTSFSQYQELARLLKASVGVTRPVYDLGFAGFERMIGQTGKTVAPRFYLGMGISGSMHHVGGIKDSKHLVSLNIDPKVPMFPNSDEGFVGDLREVVPLLLDKVKAHLTQGGAA